MPSDIDQQEIPDLLNDVMYSWMRPLQVAEFLGVSERSLRRWRKGEGIGAIRGRTLAKLTELKRLYASGGDSPPPIVSYSRSARRVAEMAKSEAADAVAKQTGNASAKAVATVRSFYESLNSKKTDKAWACLTKGFQERRWKGDFKRFEEGYRSFRGFHNLVTAPLEPVSQSVCRVLVYYEEIASIIDPPQASAWRSASISQAEEIAQSIGLARKQISRFGGRMDEVNALQLKSLFTDQAGQILLYTSRLPREQFDRALGSVVVSQAAIAMPAIARIAKSSGQQHLIDAIMPLTWGCRAPTH